MVYISTEHLKYTTLAKYYISQQNSEFSMKVYMLVNLCTEKV